MKALLGRDALALAESFSISEDEFIQNDLLLEKEEHLSSGERRLTAVELDEWTSGRVTIATNAPQKSVLLSAKFVSRPPYMQCVIRRRWIEFINNIGEQLIVITTRAEVLLWLAVSSSTLNLDPSVRARVGLSGREQRAERRAPNGCRIGG